MMTINLQRKHLSLALLLTLATLINACGGDSNPEPTIEDTLYFVHTDHLGTPQVITDGDQNTVWEGRALPFGETDIITSQITFNVRFPGQYYDHESGLHYNYFRDYDPSLGRYLQSDPIGLEGGLNTYAYVYNNAVKFVDPLGLDITVCYFPEGANRLGHVGLGVNTSSTDGFYPHPDNSGLARMNGPGNVHPDNLDQPKQCTTIDTTDEQDQLVQDYIDDRDSNPGDYNLISRNCSRFVADALNAAGIPINGAALPASTFGSINNFNSGKTQTSRGIR